VLTPGTAGTLWEELGETGHEVTSLTFHNEVKIRESPPGVTVLVVKQEVAHSSAHQRQPRTLSSSHKSLDQRGRDTWNEHPNSGRRQ
jgi:hypothetical protein